MSPIAETTTTRPRAGGALAGDPPRDAPDPVGIGERGAAELLDDERPAGIAAFYRPASRGLPGDGPAATSWLRGDRHAVRSSLRRGGARRMCFDLDCRPPIAPIAGGALDSSELTLDGGRRQPVPRRSGPAPPSRPAPGS